MCRSWQRDGAHLPSLSRVATSMRTNTSSPMIAVRIRESVGFAVLSAAITRARHERDALVSGSASRPQVTIPAPWSRGCKQPVWRSSNSTRERSKTHGANSFYER